MYDLEGRLRQKESPANGTLAYEFRALEAVLISVTLGLESEFEGVSEPVVRVLRELEEDIDRDKLRYLLIYSKKLGTFEQKARLVRDALTELLEADDPASPIARFVAKRGPGIHRICFSVDDLDAMLDRCRAAGIQLIDEQPRIGAEGKRIAFLHPRSTGGVLVELSDH